MTLRGVLAYVALGSNLGDREAMLRAACDRIDATTGLRILRASHVWETAPVGPPQPDYLNAVIEVDACLTPSAHLAALKRIEADLGRIRDPSTRWGARTIDLDLLWQGGLSRAGGRVASADARATPPPALGSKDPSASEPRELSSDDLVLPHPRIAERSFVLAPLAELTPDLVIAGATVRELLAQRPSGERGEVHRLGALLRDQHTLDDSSADR